MTTPALEPGILHFPHDELSERYIVGAAILFGHMQSGITSNHFYDARARLVWSACFQLHQHNELTDCPQENIGRVYRFLRNQNELINAGGSAYLNGLMAALTRIDFVDYHSGILNEMKIRRDLIKQAEDLIRSASDLSSDVNALIDQNRGIA
ncbi:MAG TPA: DnaB-like helicase N-terminal domain-containing protein [Planctomicrobium sp.]|nr:DnaB-like helicase N-terminal domain-containing protein [Planctomicrobium sp.]